MSKHLALLPALLLGWSVGTASIADAEPRHAIAMHGEPALASSFKHFPYVNPDAPKGGRLALGVLGSFDSLNPLIVKGVAATGLRELVIESLMTRGLDEPFTLYGLLSESIDTSADRSSVTFKLRPEARFSDGRLVGADDVVASHAILRDKGLPNLRTYYAKVAKVTRLGDREVRFDLAPGPDGRPDREMPLILGLMPILPAHRVTPETFEQTTLAPPLGSGPYTVDKVDAGRAIIYKRNPDYWGRDLAVTRGRFNFDELRFEYARDGTTLFEAFKSGALDVRIEDDPVAWLESYRFPAALDGRVVKAEVAIGLPSGMAALVFNTRRGPFKDPRVRQALIQLLDFEWINKSLYNGAYVRTQSFFDRSALAAHAKPADANERRLLAPFPDAVKPAVLDGTHAFPKGDGTGHNRDNLKAALGLLGEAGYVLVGGKLVAKADRKPFAFEIMAASRGQERLLVTWAQNLARVGIEARVRQVDSAQYQLRRTTFDFDMLQWTWGASLSPGNEQLHRWSSVAARTEGSFNLAGVASPAADAMINALLEAAERAPFEAAVRALDRVLLSGDYVIPLFHAPRQWVAHWATLAYPDRTPLTGYALDTWWRRQH